MIIGPLGVPNDGPATVCIIVRNPDEEPQERRKIEAGNTGTAEALAGTIEGIASAARGAKGTHEPE